MSGPEQRIRVSAAGDVMLGDSSHFLGRGVGSALRRHGRDPFADLRDRLRGRDVFIANLESPLGEFPGGRSWDKVYVGPAAAAEHLGLAERNVWTLANNHILEHGPGLLEGTADLLRTAGHLTAGFSPDGTDARAAVRWTCRGLDLELLADSLIPEFSRRPLDRPAREAWLLERVAAMTADVRIVSLHWGHEYVTTPSPDQVRLGRALVDAGATLVLGHHPHVLQPVERRGRGLIAYSLGNFLFDQDWTDATRLGGVLHVDVDAEGVHAWSFLPTRTGRSGRVVQAHGRLAEAAGQVVNVEARLEPSDYSALLAREARRHRIRMKTELLRHPWRVSLDTLHFLATKRRRPRPAWRLTGEDAHDGS